MKVVFPMQALTAIALASLPLMAQQSSTPRSGDRQEAANSAQPLNALRVPDRPDTGDSRNADAAAVLVPSTANSPEIPNPALRPVTGELLSKLDTRNARTGDSVVVKTVAPATTSNGIQIPKGSRIVGRVTDVEAQDRSGDDSRVAIQFDRAELRGGGKLPIESVIQGVGPGSGAAQRPGSSPPASGGSTTSPAGSARGLAAGQDPGGNAPVGTVVARNGEVAIRTTAIPGVLLAGNMNGQPFSNASGALVGARRDVHLNGGTTLILAIATAPSGANAR